MLYLNNRHNYYLWRLTYKLGVLYELSSLISTFKYQNTLLYQTLDNYLPIMLVILRP
jgi:hypothetical protein